MLGRARAIENQSFVAQCNTGGRHSGIAMGGRSQVVDPSGTVLAVAVAAAGDGADDAAVADRPVNHRTPSMQRYP